MANGVLLVEDEADLREGLAFLLEHRGYRVTTAKHGEDALAKLDDMGRPCLIILDLVMPVMDGFEFRAEIAKDEALADVPIVLLSGLGDLDRDLQAMGAVACLTKPLDLDVLYDLLAKHCHVVDDASGS